MHTKGAMALRTQLLAAFWDPRYCLIRDPQAANLRRGAPALGEAASGQRVLGCAGAVPL